MIRLIGYWKESLGDDYPLPQELETEYAPDVRDRLVAYLESGAPLVQYRGLSWCRYDCDQPEGNGSRELCDGDWAWPEGLAHYVRRHSVGLPPEFVRRATSQERLPPPAFMNAEARRAELDDSDWIAWGRLHRTPAVDAMLSRGRASAMRVGQARLAIRALELEAQHGVGPDGCAWAGCDRRTLAGKAICAAHVAEKEIWILLAAEAEELQRLLRTLDPRA